MKIKLPLFTVIGVFALLTGCRHAATRVTAVKDPATQKLYQKLIVYAAFSDLESRKTTENSFVRRLKDTGVDATPSLTLLPPTREYPGSDFVRTVQASGNDGVLMVFLTDSISRRVYVPGSSQTTGEATAKSTGYGTTITYSEQTQNSGGFFISKPLVYYRLELWDVKDETMAWLATSQTRGNGFATFNTLVHSVAGKTIGQMKKDGVIAKKE